MASAVPSYEEQQELLRRETEGESGIQIEIPKEPEVDPAVYKDVEAMLFRGFIVAPANINGERFVFKSLNQHEYGLLTMAAGETLTSKFWDVFLAHCVLMVDGINVLSNREEHIPELIDAFRVMPRGARDRIIRHLSEINRRAAVCVLVAEAYATESYSRYRWAQLRGVDLTQTAVTGIHGTDRLGLNWPQLAWRAINYYEDIRDQNERDWENSKFVGSCMAGKGISKVYRQDEERRRKEREEKFARKDSILRHILLGEPLKDISILKFGAPIVGARTEEELVDQLEKSLRGEKDFHDRIVDAHERQSRERVDEQRQQIETLVKRHEDEYQGKAIIGSTDLTGLTASQVRELMTQKKTLQAQQAAQNMVYPEFADKKQSDFALKWFSESPVVESDPGSVDESTALPVNAPLPPRTPRFRR